MEKFVVSVESSGNYRARNRHLWKRSVPELDGRLSSTYRREASQLLLDSYSEVARIVTDVNQDPDPTHLRGGVSGLEFDLKGVYLAAVTKTGFLTVHDFESLYCTTNGSDHRGIEHERKHLLHLRTSQPLGSVRWNMSNQDEIFCASRQTNRILIFDIGYVSSEPVEVLVKGRPQFTGHNCDLYAGFSDIAFPTDDKTRIFSSGLDGAIYLWDRRLGHLPYVALYTSSRNQLTSVKLDTENRVIFGASQNGFVYAWDLRGGRASLAFQRPNEVFHPLLASVKISSMLEKITSLKAQVTIVSRGIHSINFDPCCSYQLAFHLEDGWSGVLNLNSFDVTHVHCPPPAWLCDNDIPTCSSDIRKPNWLARSSIFAVCSSSGQGMYLLDFYPNASSVCHVDYDDGFFNGDGHRFISNRFLHLSKKASVLASHPINDTIIAGTKESSLLLISQKHFCSSGDD